MSGTAGAATSGTQGPHILLEGLIKHWDNRKWKQRWAIVSKLSPVADCLYVSLYRSCKDKFRSAEPKKVVPLEEYLGIESGFGHENETNTLAVICKREVTVFAFDTREILTQWKNRLQSHFCREQHFLVQVLKTPTGSKISPGPARLIVQNFIFCLVSSLPPRLLGYWPLDQLRRFGEIDGKFCFEAGSHCKVAGLHVLYTSQATEIVKCLELASAGQLIHSSHNGSDCDSIFGDEKSLVYASRPNMGGHTTLKSGSSDTSSNCDSCSNLSTTTFFGQGACPGAGNPMVHSSLHNIALSQQYLHSTSSNIHLNHGHHHCSTVTLTNNCSATLKKREICNSNSSSSCSNCRITHQQQQQQQQNRCASLFGTIRNHSIVHQQSPHPPNGIDQNTTDSRSHLCPLPVFTGPSLPLGGGNSAGNSSSSPSTTTSSSTDRESIFSHSSSECSNPANDLNHQLHRLEEALLSFETPPLDFSHLYSQIDFSARASARASNASSLSNGSQIPSQPIPMLPPSPQALPPPVVDSLAYSNYDVPKNLCLHSSCVHTASQPPPAQASSQFSANSVACSGASINHCQWPQHPTQQGCTADTMVQPATHLNGDVVANKAANPSNEGVGIVVPKMENDNDVPTPLCHHSHTHTHHHDYENMHFTANHNLDFTVGLDPQFPPPPPLQNCSTESAQATEKTKSSGSASNWHCHSSTPTPCDELCHTTTAAVVASVGNYTPPSSTSGSDCSHTEMTESREQPTDKREVLKLQQHKCLCLNANGTDHFERKCVGNDESRMVGPGMSSTESQHSDEMSEHLSSQEKTTTTTTKNTLQRFARLQSTCDKMVHRHNGTICRQSSPLHRFSPRDKLATEHNRAELRRDKSRSIGDIENIENIDPLTRRHKSDETLDNAFKQSALECFA